MNKTIEVVRRRETEEVREVSRKSRIVISSTSTEPNKRIKYLDGKNNM